MNRRQNYDVLEREYVAGTMSLRELARMHNIGNHSLVMAQSKRREWPRKRAEYQTQASERAVIYMADEEGMRRAQEARVRDNAIEAIDEAISKMRSDMKATRKVLAGAEWVDEPLVIIKPADIAMLIDRFQVLFGKPSAITEERSLGLSFNANTSPDTLRDIIEATRHLAVGDGTTGSPIPRTDRGREN